jgi:hypothetical protein
MSAEHRQSCRVFLEDTIPSGTLRDPAGRPHALPGALGESLNVLIFWNARHPYALDQFRRIGDDLGPLCQRGVRVFAIHVGPEPDNLAELCEQYGDAALCLTDPQREYFEQFARGAVPRTYLGDARGKVLWLDIEYSRTTRRDLRNMLRFLLRDEPADGQRD